MLYATWLAVSVYLIAQSVQPRQSRLRGWSMVLLVVTLIAALELTGRFDSILLTLILSALYMAFVIAVSIIEASFGGGQKNYLRAALWVSITLMLSLLLEVLLQDNHSAVVSLSTIIAVLLYVDSPDELNWGARLNWYSFAISLCIAGILFWARSA